MNLNIWKPNFVKKKRKYQSISFMFENRVITFVFLPEVFFFLFIPLHAYQYKLPAPSLSLSPYPLQSPMDQKPLNRVKIVCLAKRSLGRQENDIARFRYKKKIFSLSFK